MAEITIKDLRQRHIEDFLRARREIRKGKADLNAESYAASLVGFATQLAKQKLEGQQFNVTLEKYVEGLLKLEERQGELTQAEEDGVMVRAAARCDWFDDLDEGAVDDLAPWEVDQLSSDVAETFNDAFAIPKN